MQVIEQNWYAASPSDPNTPVLVSAQLLVSLGFFRKIDVKGLIVLEIREFSPTDIFPEHLFDIPSWLLSFYMYLASGLVQVQIL